MRSIDRAALDAVLFDLDGTLWDSAAGVSQAWQRALERRPPFREPITETEFRSCMGLCIDEIGKKIFPTLPEAERDSLIRECLEEEHRWLRQVGGRVYGRVEETLSLLSRKLKLCVVSNCEAGYIENFFAITGLSGYFADHISFGETGRHKSDNARLIMERNRFQAPVFVGDTVLDREAARLTGMPFIYAAYGFGRLDDYDYTIDAFGELTELLL